jgi:LmbE family N-acetylglucosaminyl deacetylase
MKVLAIGAHPDDVEVGCGGTLLKFARLNHEINVFFLTRGGAGGSIKQREKEARNSAKSIGLKNLWFGDYRDTQLTPNGALVNDIEKMVNRVKPDFIFSHSSTDEHHDHRAVGLATIEAARLYPRILAYEIPLTKNFQPQLYVDISDVIHDKVKLIAIYDSQMSRRYLIRDAIFGLAQYRALQSRLPNTEFVEAFQVVKFIWEIT